MRKWHPFKTLGNFPRGSVPGTVRKRLAHERPRPVSVDVVVAAADAVIFRDVISRQNPMPPSSMLIALPAPEQALFRSLRRVCQK